MPELPEVETMRRGILGVVGARITAAERTRCQRKPILVAPEPKPFQKRVVGQTIQEIGRVGKRVVIHLSGGDAIVIEPRMTGLVLLADPPSLEHLRFRLALDHASVPEVWYWDRRGLGSVRLFAPAEFAVQFGPDKLGPDALAISAEEMRDRLCRSRREIKVGLLDQRAVTGVGNLYASEILHRARIHPQRRCDELTLVHWRAVHKAMGEILADAIRHEGSTLGDGTYRNALNKAGGYQNHHRVYARAGEACRDCGRAAIERIVQAQRATFFCPRCQKLSAAGKSGLAAER